MNYLKHLVLILILMPIFMHAQEDELAWPREIETTGFLITMYQPQLESFEQNILEGRMAVSIKPKEKEMIFCAVWFKAKLDTDLDERIATIEKIEITKVHFPDMDDKEGIDKLSKFLESEISSWDFEMSLDRLIATLNDVENLNDQSVKLNNSPPKIYYRKNPTTLVSIDGDPIFKKIDNSNLEYVVNTAFFLVSESGKSPYFINGGKFWYTSNSLMDGWVETKKIPDDIKKLAEDNLKDVESDSDTINTAPNLIIVIEPSELVLTEGEPDYASIEGTSLLYVKNSESEIIMNVNSNEHYILIAGRWYHSKTLKDGDWIFAEPESLPEDFAKIPESSDMSTVRASIPGTPEAKDALLEQSIPQTATVDRKTATVEVKYDGEPEFNKVENTSVSYAKNTDKTVLLIDDKYYCVENAIWFISDNATGPWLVSDVRPSEVDDLPPSSEVYNVKYVYIYDSTPEVVYVGYYPGYTYSYAYGGVVVYGTGYYYAPWYRAYYYPRPVTYGFGVHYNPITGWGFSVGFSYGWVGWGFHPYHGYWGARGYHAGYRHGYHNGYRHGARAGYRAGYHAANRPTKYNKSRNVYRTQASGVRSTKNINRSNVGKVSNTKARPSTKPNNIYTDNRGNVHQRNNDGSWSQKSNRASTSNSQSRTRENITKPTNRSSNVNRSNTQQQLNNSYQNRNKGSQNYNRSRTSSTQRRSPSQGGGGRRR